METLGAGSLCMRSVCRSERPSIGRCGLFVELVVGAEGPVSTCALAPLRASTSRCCTLSKQAASGVAACSAVLRVRGRRRRCGRSLAAGRPCFAVQDSRSTRAACQGRHGARLVRRAVLGSQVAGQRLQEWPSVRFGRIRFGRAHHGDACVRLSWPAGHRCTGTIARPGRGSSMEPCCRFPTCRP